MTFRFPNNDYQKPLNLFQMINLMRCIKYIKLF